MLELALPAERFEHSFLAAELDRDERDVTSHEAFVALVLRLAKDRAGLDLAPGWVAATTWWLVDGDEYLGRLSIRHELTDALRALGGHIGYDVRPSRRRQGLGTRMLELGLPRAFDLGIDPAMITCDADNVGSRRIIERCGGVLDAEYLHEGSAKLRFWIATRRS